MKHVAASSCQKAPERQLAPCASFWLCLTALAQVQELLMDPVAAPSTQLEAVPFALSV